MHYICCPICGTKLTARAAGDDGQVPYCENCGKYWFDTFPSSVIVLVHNEFGEIVLGKQSYMSDIYESFTSGYITPGETAEETAYREVEEEIGLELETLEYAGTYWFAKGGMLMHGFIGYAKKRDLTLSDEVDSAEWVPAEDAPPRMFPDSPGNAQYGVYKKFMAKRDRR